MRNKITAAGRLINLYEGLLRENLSERYRVHCTDSQRVVDAVNKALNEEYKDRMKEFKDLLLEVGIH